jgi:hypothetical protein
MDESTKKISNKIFLCKECGENNQEKFIPGRYTTCRKCRNSQSAKINILRVKSQNQTPKNIQIETSVLEEIKFSLLKEIQILQNQYLSLSKKIDLLNEKLDKKTR